MALAPQVSDTALPHARFIGHRLPKWLKLATAKQRADLRKALITCHYSAARASEVLEPIKSLDVFAEPILELDLKASHPELHDMQRATLDKRWQRSTVLWQPIYDASPEHSLLEAALYNFEEWETRSTAFGSGSGIYLTGKSRGLKSNLRPETLALRCRQLDLGKKYLLHLRQVLDDTNPANEPFAPANKHQLLIRHQRNRFAAELHMAYLSANLSGECTQALNFFLHPYSNTFGKLLLCHRVMLLGHVLPGVVHFAADPENDKGRCAVYFHGHPDSPFKEYSSLLTFQGMFMTSLHSAQTRQWASQLLPIDYQEPLLLEKLKSDMRASTGHDVQTIRLSSSIEVELFEETHRLRLLHLMSDLGRLAPSAEDVKAADREQLLDQFQTAGLNLLPSLKNRIPRFKRALADPTDLMGANAIFQDLHTWSQTERLAGSLHLLNIVEARTSGQVTQQMRDEGATLPYLITVRMEGRTRLWKPDPSQYRVTLHLPEDQWQPNALGLYAWTNKHYLLLDEAYYEVRYNTTTGHWHIVSPTRPSLYAPPLRHNSVGAWRSIHEDARKWSEPALIARLSPHAARLPRSLATALLPLGGSNLQTLRQLHHYCRRTSPQLLDSLKRLWILREIEGFLDQAPEGACSGLCTSIRAYLAQQLPGVPAQTPVRLIKRKSRKFIQYPKGSQWVDIDEADWLPGLFGHLYRQLEQPSGSRHRRLRVEYPDLPLSIMEDLDFTLQPLEQTESTLPNLHKELQRALEQARISRVFEALYPDAPHARQSEHLAFSLLEMLAGWPRDMSLELIDADHCKLGQSIGADPASLNYRRLLRKEALYEIQDRQGKTLSTASDFYNALWQALPNAVQRDLCQRNGISPEEERTTAELKRALFKQASRLRGQMPAIRTLQDLPEPPATASAAPLPVQFAVPGRAVSGLQLRDGGIYWNLNHRPLANHAHRHFILEGHHYYPVKWSPEGWRLLNASNPYGFYQPLLQRRSRDDPRWILHHPEHPRQLLERAQSLPVPVNNGARNEPSRKKMFTEAQRKRLQTPKSYRSCLNSPLTYDRVDNARYPLRGLDGQPMTITALHYSQAPGAVQSQARAQQLLPYLAQGMEVARLYENKLSIRRFQPRHMASAEEHHLIGRFRVTARSDLGTGELLGVHGGMLIPLLVCHHRKDPFATWVHEERSLELLRVRDGQPQAALPCLTGDNILSRINTIFEYEGGVPVRQALAGYNVEAVAFPVDVRVDDGCSGQQRYFINALFTSRAVMADEELRINHGYTEEQIQTLNSAQPLGPATAE